MVKELRSMQVNNMQSTDLTYENEQMENCI